VLWASFALALAFGAIAQHTRFCTMGAIADVVNMGDWERARMWALAIAVAVVIALGLWLLLRLVTGLPQTIIDAMGIGPAVGLSTGLRKPAAPKG